MQWCWNRYMMSFAFIRCLLDFTFNSLVDYQMGNGYASLNLSQITFPSLD